MNREAVESLDKETLIRLVLAQAETIAALTRQVELLTARVAELEAKLGLPPKTPDNSSTPPSQGQKPSEQPAVSSDSKNPRKAHPGAHRRLHPNPTTRRDVMASSCQHCGAAVFGVPQMACEAYDHIEVPAIVPQVTRVTLHGGTCLCCAKTFKAAAPQRLGPLSQCPKAAFNAMARPQSLLSDYCMGQIGVSENGSEKVCDGSGGVVPLLAE